MSKKRQGTYITQIVEFQSDMSALRDKTGKLLSNKNIELFKTIIIEPENVLSKEQLAHIKMHTSILCANEQLSVRIKECAEKNPEGTIGFLEAALVQFNRGVFDKTEIKGKAGKTESRLQKELIDEFSAQLAAVKQGSEYPEVNALNKQVLEFRSATQSLYEEYVDQRMEYTKTKVADTYAMNAIPLKQVLFAEFEENGKVITPPKWDANKATPAELSTAVVAAKKVPTYEYSKHIIIDPKADTVSHHIDSAESMLDLNTKSYFFLDGTIGAAQVYYVKNVLLPTAFTALCAGLKALKSSGSLSTAYDISNAFEKYEFTAVNFQTIFKGFDTDYHAKIVTASEHLSDVRLINGDLDLSFFTKGVHTIIEMTTQVELLWKLPPSKVVADLFAQCPEYAAEFLGSNPMPLAIAAPSTTVAGETHATDEL